MWSSRLDMIFYPLLTSHHCCPHERYVQWQWSTVGNGWQMCWAGVFLSSLTDILWNTQQGQMFKTGVRACNSKHPCNIIKYSRTNLRLRSCWAEVRSGHWGRASPCSRWRIRRSWGWNTWASMFWYTHLRQRESAHISINRRWHFNINPSDQSDWHWAITIQGVYALSLCEPGDSLPLLWSQPSLTTLTSFMARDVFQRGPGTRGRGGEWWISLLGFFKSQSQFQTQTAPDEWNEQHKLDMVFFKYLYNRNSRNKVL